MTPQEAEDEVIRRIEEEIKNNKGILDLSGIGFVFSERINRGLLELGEISSLNLRKNGLKTIPFEVICKLSLNTLLIDNNPDLFFDGIVANRLELIFICIDYNHILRNASKFFQTSILQVNSCEDISPLKIEDYGFGENETENDYTFHNFNNIFYLEIEAKYAGMVSSIRSFDSLTHLLIHGSIVDSIEIEIVDCPNLKKIIAPENCSFDLYRTGIKIPDKKMSKIRSINWFALHFDCMRFMFHFQMKVKETKTRLVLDKKTEEKSREILPFFVKSIDTMLTESGFENLYSSDEAEFHILKKGEHDILLYRPDPYILSYSGLGFEIDGPEETRLQIAKEIRGIIENAIEKSQLKNVGTISRSFFLPSDETDDNGGLIDIDYDYLIYLKEMGETFYIHRELKKRYPIKTLLEYIDGDSEEDNEPRFVAEASIPNQLSGLSIENFKLFKKLEISFNPVLNIFLGSNGFGKTSILQSIALPLVLPEFEPEDPEKYISLGQESARLQTRWGEHSIEMVVGSLEMKKNNQFNHRQPVVLGYGTHIQPDERPSYTEIIADLVTGGGKSMAVHSLFDKRNEPFYDPLIVLERLGGEALTSFPEHKKDTKKVQKLLWNSLNAFLELNDIEQKIKITSEKNGFYFDGLGQQKMKLKHLSEGYKTNILIVTDILLRILGSRNRQQKYLRETWKIEEVFLKCRGVLLIDEFDRHLHPAWQKVFLSKLKDFFPNMQLFVTTHNPMSVLDRENSEIKEMIYHPENGTMELREYGGTKTKDVSEVLLTYFGLDSVLSKHLQHTMDEYYALQLLPAKNKKAVARMEALGKTLKEANLGFVVPDQSYLKFLAFAKRRNIDLKALKEKDFDDSGWDELFDELN